MLHIINQYNPSIILLCMFSLWFCIRYAAQRIIYSDAIVRAAILCTSLAFNIYNIVSFEKYSLQYIFAPSSISKIFTHTVHEYSFTLLIVVTLITILIGIYAFTGEFHIFALTHIYLALIMGFIFAPIASYYLGLLAICTIITATFSSAINKTELILLAIGFCLTDMLLSLATYSNIIIARFCIFTVSIIMCGIPPFGYFITHLASKMNPIFAAIFSSFNAIIFLLLSMKYQVFFAPFATVIGCATILYALYNIITERYLTKISLFINQFYLGLFIYANSSANYCSQNLIISMATWIIIHISIILYIHYLENITQHKLHVYNITLLAAKQWQRVAIIMPIICLILPISNMPTAYILQTIHSNIFAITATAAVGIIVSYKLIYGAIIVHNQSINNKQYCRLYHQMVACIMLIIALLLTQHYYLNITHNASHYHLVPYIAQLAMFVTIILSLIRYNKIILPYIAIEPHKTDIQIAYSQIIAPFLRILSTIIVQFITLFYRIMLMAVQSVAKHNHINYITKLNNSINIFNPAVTIYVFFTLLLAMLYCIM